MAGDRGPTVLVVSGDSAVRGATTTVMPLAGWRVLDVPSASLAVHNLRAKLPEALVMDQRFQEGDALGVIRSLRYIEGQQDVVIVLLVEAIDRQKAVEYYRAGVHIFLAKPMDIVELCERLAERVADAEQLAPPAPIDDPLARPTLVVASPNMNLRELADKAMSDEFDMVFFDGTRGVDADKRWATVMLIDEGLPGGLEAMSTWRALFGQGPAIAITARGGGEPLEDYVTTITKPVRDTVLKRAVRQISGRLHFGIFPMSTGLIVRIRDGWHNSDEAAFAGFLERLGELADLTVSTGRRWLCIDGPYIGATEHLVRTRALFEAAGRSQLAVGLVSLQSDTSYIQIHCGVPAHLIHASTASFVKYAQDLI